MRTNFGNGISYDVRRGVETLDFSGIYITREGDEVTNLGLKDHWDYKRTIDPFTTPEQRQELVGLATLVFDRIRSIPSAKNVGEASREMFSQIRERGLTDSATNRIGIVLEQYSLN